MEDKKQIERLSKKVNDYLKDNAALLKKHKLASRVVIYFPEGKKPSLISKLAIWILGKSGAGFDTEFTITK
ncbi:MAG: hypothetical protein ACD_5C00016G0015 [uncultured bacterium]|nr:MAG: hypothetical protein ACD_5C00016G0015 [uncultured bacterium]